MTDAPIARLKDRRNPINPAREVILYPDRIEWVESGKLERRIALDAVSSVRLSVELAGQQSQVVCRIGGPSGEIVFGSRKAVSPGVWDDNALEFQTLLVRVHESLRPRFDGVRFTEGQTLGFRLLMGGIGVVMTSMAISYMGWMLLKSDNTMLALAGLPFAVIGGYLAFVFRPGRPVPYDPEGLITRFKAVPKTD
ncbi:hypothetical protein ACFELO_14125 [Oceanicaulis sp. LC35]|uniref:hypothetical protein n=1 Tax=Oceanicaulis sp. LC35 TaxID=3349635 RepID=UPI003F832645